jgi:hypothetical protein
MTELAAPRPYPDRITTPHLDYLPLNVAQHQLPRKFYLFWEISYRQVKPPYRLLDVQRDKPILTPLLTKYVDELKLSLFKSGLISALVIVSSCLNLNPSRTSQLLLPIFPQPSTKHFFE